MRVLIVEDDDNQRLLYRETFEADGHQVLEADGAPAAIELVRSDRPDVVVLDINMPGLDGLDTLAAIHALDRRLPIVLNTAYTAYREHFVSWIADAYVVKSSDLTELRETVRDVVARRARGPAPQEPT
ncbi:response regulator [Candidatus Binatia bacterium]|jgi:DNA-binding response OmpR family regulator|nr:response regulator [Candidatus Binatia bacterium]